MERVWEIITLFLPSQGGNFVEKMAYQEVEADVLVN